MILPAQLAVAFNINSPVVVFLTKLSAHTKTLHVLGL